MVIITFSNLVVSFLLASLSFLLITAIPSHAISPTLICPKTRNPPFCFSVLKSAGTTDLIRLASYTLNLAHANAGKTLSRVQSLAAEATNPRLKERYASCSESYDEAIGDIEQAQHYLASGDYNGVNVETAGVMALVDDCQDNFKQPPTSSILKNGKVLKDICSIILVISNLLP